MIGKIEREPNQVSMSRMLIQHHPRIEDSNHTPTSRSQLLLTMQPNTSLIKREEITKILISNLPPPTITPVTNTNLVMHPMILLATWNLQPWQDLSLQTIHPITLMHNTLSRNNSSILLLINQMKILDQMQVIEKTSHIKEPRVSKTTKTLITTNLHQLGLKTSGLSSPDTRKKESNWRKLELT